MCRGVLRQGVPRLCSPPSLTELEKRAQSLLMACTRLKQCFTLGTQTGGTHIGDTQTGGTHTGGLKTVTEVSFHKAFTRLAKDFPKACTWLAQGFLHNLEI